jgi:hypothetical protein
MNKRLVFDTLWLAVWAICSSCWCCGAAQELGPTYDEPFYVESGLECWDNLSPKNLLAAGTMPLPVEVETLPLHLAKLVVGADPAKNLQTWLPYARMTTLFFWWMLLAATFAAAWHWSGRAAARLAVALVATEPILLGHASLATTDIAFAACVVAFVVLYRVTRQALSFPKRPLLCGVGVGLTLLSKVSALAYIPVCLVVLEAEYLWNTGWRPSLKADGWLRLIRSAAELAMIGALGVAVLFMCCPRALRAFVYQVRHQLAGVGPVYLLGATSPTGFWYYFPVALLIKLSLPVLVLLLLVLVFRPRYCGNGPFLLVAALLALSTSFRVQIGVRFVLPIAVLAIVAGAMAWARWLQEAPRSRLRRFGSLGLCASLIVWSTANAWLAWPQGLCYTNELFGGTANGYLALSDSNYDWGQGLKELAAWQRSHDQAPLNVCYFGTDPLLKALPMQAVRLAEVKDSAEVREKNRGNFLAVSTTFLYGEGFESPAARYLRQLQPCDRTTTYLIYDFSHD